MGAAASGATAALTHAPSNAQAQRGRDAAWRRHFIFLAWPIISLRSYPARALQLVVGRQRFVPTPASTSRVPALPRSAPWLACARLCNR